LGDDVVIQGIFRRIAMSENSYAFSTQVNSLADQFEATLADTEWSIHRDKKRMRDEVGEIYEVPALTLVKGATRLLLDPNGFGFPGAEAGVDLFLLPPYDPVASLYLEKGTWFIHSPFPRREIVIARPKEWARTEFTPDAIRTVLESIADHAVPSV
jgi:hypothetical protein